MNTITLTRNGKTTKVNAKWRDRFVKTGWEIDGDEPEQSTSVSIDDLVKLVESSNSKEDIEAIVLDAKGIDIDKRGGLDAVKKKAVAALTGESDEG